MGKRCGNCANGTWIKGTDAVTEVCLECSYVLGEPSNWKEKTLTNADRIRAMSDEELAKRLLTIDGPGVFCKTLPECEELLDTDEGIPEEKCLRCMLAWLQQPVEE